MYSFDWWLNLATCAGITILAGPVWSLNRRKRRRHLVRQADAQARDDSEFRTRMRKIFGEKLDGDVNDWRRIDEVCLVFGYSLLLGSAVARVLFPGA
jgi:hypothetical protein